MTETSRKNLSLASAMLAGLLLVPSTAKASAILSFSDPALGPGEIISTAGDITGVTLALDTSTGAYTVTWTATAANPFNGNVRVNLNLGNAAVGPQVISLSSTFLSQSATTQLSYSGTNSALLAWHVGDTIVSSGGLPTFTTNFGSGNVDLDNPAIANRDQLQQTSAILTSTTAPEPATLALIGVGSLMAFVRARRRR